ncbi:MAG: hypothetical protein HRU20_17580 [Pseudomonadales bacterium]|nr:hypothetical protein [Pseudomonadales bacterium]
MIPLLPLISFKLVFLSPFSRRPTGDFLSTLLFFLLLIACPSASVYAERLQWNGVFNQGLTHTSDNNFYGDSANGISLEFTEFITNGSYKIHKNFRLAGQVLYRRAGEVSDGIEVDYFFLDSLIWSSELLTSGLIVGRFKNPFGLYNATRDVAFTRPGIFLPQSIYPDTFRDILISSDGLLLYATAFTDLGQWNLEIAYGKPRVEELGEYTSDDLQVNNEKSTMSRLIFEAPMGQWQAGFSYAKYYADFNSGLGSTPMAIDSNIAIEQIIFSFQYTLQRWTFTSEYSQLNIGLDFPVFVIPSFSPPFTPTTLDLSREVPGESYYFQLEQQINAHFSSLIRWDIDYANKNDKDGSEYEATNRGPAHSRFAKDLTLGIRWHVTKNMMINAEYHNVNGTSWLSNKDNPPGSTTQYWDLLSFSFAYRF